MAHKTISNRSLQSAFAGGLFLIAVALAPNAVQAQTASDPAQSVDAEQVQIEKRLQLTEDQLPAFRSIMQVSKIERAGIMKKHGFDPSSDERLSLTVLLALGTDMNRFGKRLDEKLVAVLSAGQMNEFGKIQAEQAKAMRQRLLQQTPADRTKPMPDSR